MLTFDLDIEKIERDALLLEITTAHTKGNMDCDWYFDQISTELDGWFYIQTKPIMLTNLWTFNNIIQ